MLPSTEELRADPYRALGVVRSASLAEAAAARDRVINAAINLARTGDETALAVIVAARAAYIQIEEQLLCAQQAASHFSSAVKFDTFINSDSYYRGSGEVRVEGDQLKVHARRRRLFSLRKKTEAWPLAEVRNVSMDGKVVRFSCPIAGSKKRWNAVLVCPAADRAEALITALPTTEDAAAYTAHDVQRQLDQQLKSFSPYTPVSWALIVANVLVYFAVSSVGGKWMTADTAQLIALGGNFPPLTTEGEWWRLITATFMHAGLMHLAMNMIALYSFGRMAERLHGWKIYLASYLMCGLAASTGTLLAHPASVGVGASGAIFGIVGVWAAFLARDHKLLPDGGRRKLFTNFAVFIGYSLAQGFSAKGIDNAAHIAGLACGLVIGFALGLPAAMRLETEDRNLPRRLGWGFACAILGSSVAIAYSPRLGPDYRTHNALTGIFSEWSSLNQKLVAEVKPLQDREKAGTLKAQEAEAWFRSMSSRYALITGKLRSLEARTNSLRERRELLLDINQRFIESLDLGAQATRTNDPSLEKQAATKMAEAVKLIEKMRKPRNWWE